MGCLGKSQILAANDRKMEKVMVPEWAEGDPEAYVMVRTMSAGERDRWEEMVFHTDFSDPENPRADVDKANYRAKLCALCMVDDEGNRLFADEDIPDLSNKSAEALQRVFEVVQRLNGMVAKKSKNAE